MYAGVSIAVDNTGPEIHLHWSDAPETETEDCALASSLTACTALPHDGLPARDIWLRTAGPNDSCGWTPSYLIRTLGHEMGHALGFSHPNGENSSHVEGTAECTASVCAFAQNYATIMGAFAFPSSDACVPDAPYLACDDILTEQMIYPPANGLPSECQ
jgi:hypothetical protein